MRRRGRQSITIIGRHRPGRDWVDDGVRVRSHGWLLLPMPAEEQERMGLQVIRRWKMSGPLEVSSARAQVEADDILDDATGRPLRLDIRGAIEMRRDLAGRPHHAHGVVEIVEGVR